MILPCKIYRKKRSYFVERPLTISEKEDSFVFSTQSSVQEIQIIYDTIEHLVLCKSVYNAIYIDVADNFCEYL